MRNANNKKALILLVCFLDFSSPRITDTYSLALAIWKVIKKPSKRISIMKVVCIFLVQFIGLLLIPLQTGPSRHKASFMEFFSIRTFTNRVHFKSLPPWAKRFEGSLGMMDHTFFKERMIFRNQRMF